MNYLVYNITIHIHQFISSCLSHPIKSFKYEVNVQKSTKDGLEPGKHKLTLEYYPKSYSV